ncbi:CRISPR-associated endonuclease Cas2 [Clostridium felsineum]|uniref:CRISPR-associated endoribonuclease Cas2 n=1 Tax=Clostridium felsineum TaxID=36839 RepID=A0A1S8LLA4_9CLOT|nr:CRISPR-associated endonuclease Cas2 [Clostridium felsineum]URZ05946.1 CRISPR-associated endoribonuclease Cas2 [Clostridium felsineum]URZ10983.1 CRISPR-associated endoribonuclease Cas2 [Clostridium felsineum]
MMVLVTYDVNTESDGGKTRLRRVAKICVNYGQRVQNSVFECLVNPAQFVELKNSLSKTIDSNKDSLRFYLLGKNWEKRVEQIGKNDTYHPLDDAIII